MKLKVIHLIRKLDTINRDLEELENIKNNLRDNREYTDRLRHSFIAESLRLKNLKEKILSQAISGSPTSLHLDTETGKRKIKTEDVAGFDGQTMEPEITIPGDRKKEENKKIKEIKSDNQTDEIKTKVSEISEKKDKTEVREGTPIAKKVSSDSNAFQFRYGESEK